MIFRWLEENFFAWFVPLRARRELCDTLLEIGVPARLAKGRRPEEEYGSGRYAGLIDIADGPIRWINIDFVPGGPDYPSYYIIEYGVPDSRPLPEVSFSAVFARTFPRIGRITCVRWKGKDGTLGILDCLNNDASVSGELIENSNFLLSLTVHAAPKRASDKNCWIIAETPNGRPSIKLWSCYQAIARHLVNEWKSESDP